MTGRRNIIIAVSAIVVFAAIVGFFITLDVSPQIAYARLFIDAGLVIGLVAIVMALYREKALPVESVLQALRSLKSAQYKTRLPADLGALSEIATSINELAAVLEEQHHKQEEIKRNLREELLPSFKQKDVLPTEHSFHPELGPVHSLPGIKAPNQVKDSIYSFRDIVAVPIPQKKLETAALSNTLIASKPPKETQTQNRVDSSVQEMEQEQDMLSLYQRFIDAQKSIDLEEIEYSLFLKTIEKAKKDLMASYKCHGVFFDVVQEENQVALQPKIVRDPR